MTTVNEKELRIQAIDAYLKLFLRPRPKGAVYSLNLPGSSEKPKEEARETKESISAWRDSRSLRTILEKKRESFTVLLLRLIDESGETDAEIYKAAGLDRKYFSKIRSGSIPRKETVMALCLALKLDRDRADDLMRQAGYAFSQASSRDLIVRWCIEHEVYRLMEVNELLQEFREPLIRA